jgi:CheY-like chemotaxis protein
MARKKKLLIADNLIDYLEEEKELLENEGYQVRTASNPEQARSILSTGAFDLIILDIRLRDDDDENDTSGLDIAREVAPKIPKIILTAYPTWEGVKQAMAPNLNGLPAAVDFLSKTEGPDAIIRAIELALDAPIFRKNLLEVFDVPNMMAIPPHLNSMEIDAVTDRLQKSFDKTSRQLVKVQEDQVRRAARLHRLAIAMAIAGMFVILFGAILAFMGYISQIITTSVATVLLEAISVLFFQREDAAHRQVRDSYSQLDEMNKLNHLLSICDTIQTAKKREEQRVKVIEAITQKWFGYK